MRKVTIFLLVLFSISLSAKEINKEISYKSYDQAKSSKNRLQFIVESTKAGLFSSDVDGYVKVFSYSADLDDKNMILRNMKIVFNPKTMDTDDESRDKKLHNLCMSYKKYPQVEINVQGPMFLKTSKPQKYKGTVKIRGKVKPFEIELLSENKNSEYIMIKGNANWSLKGMEIPDPSIFIAKLSDEIRIQISIKEKIK